jgi:uncharacterized protein
VLAHRGLTEHGPRGGAAPTVIETFAWSRCELGGCWYPAVTVGEAVHTDQPLGTVTDLLGSVVQQPRSQVDGTVLFAVTSLAINAGDPLVGIGVPTR